MIQYLRAHALLWILPVILVPLIVFAIYRLASIEASTPDSPFIYDL